MTQTEISNKSKEVVRAYLAEGISHKWADVFLFDVEDEDDFDDILDEADDIMSWVLQRFDTALQGRR